MADGVNITEGTGKTVGCDELTDATIGGLRQIQYIKVMDGTVDSSNKMVVDSSGDAHVSAKQSGTWTVQPGNTPNSTPWLFKVSDGTNAAAIKAASTAAVATDPSLVVQISPIGEVADGATDSGNGNKISAKAYAGLSGQTLVSAGQRVDLAAGIDRVQYVRVNCGLEDIVTGVATDTGGSAFSVIAAAGSGLKIYVTDVTISNTSATNVTVDLRDGTGGAVKWTFPVPANSGVVKEFNSPLPFSANTAVAADSSAAVSTISVSIAGFKSKV